MLTGEAPLASAMFRILPFPFTEVLFIARSLKFQGGLSPEVPRPQPHAEREENRWVQSTGLIL